jgi:hypothetical protein
VFGDDAFEDSLTAASDAAPTHPDDGARHRRVAERAAEHLAARMARANDRAGHRPAVSTDEPTRPLSPPDPDAGSALVEPRPGAGRFDDVGDVGFDALISPATTAVPRVSEAAPGRDPAPVAAPVAAPSEPAMPAATEPIETLQPGEPTRGDALTRAAARERDVRPESDADSLLAAIDPDGLLEPGEQPAGPAKPVRERARACPRSRSRRAPNPRVLAVAAAAGVLVVGGIGVAIAGAGSSAPSSPGGTSSSESRDAVEAAPTATITGDLSETAAPVTGGTEVSVAGENLDEVAQVSVGGAEAAIVDATADRLTFTVPPAADDAVGEVPVVFSDAQGNPATDATGTGALTLTYTNDPGIDAQLAYVSEHWDAYNPDYPVLPGQDSVNFASQSLVARGWDMDDVWNADGETGTMSAAWSGSTALRDYLRTRSDRATELSDAQREDVKAGDIAQFDWDDSGDRDFTAVVTRVEQTDEGAKVWIAAHSNDVEAWDVDSALASGGTVSYFSIR